MIRRDKSRKDVGKAFRAALRAAHSIENDVDARQQLKDDLAKGEPGANKALEILARMRDQFDMDRAYRLLYATITDTSVQPISTANYDLFVLEERLGRLPLAKAFAFLAERRPSLLQVEQVAESEGSGRNAFSVKEGVADGDASVPPRISTVLGPAAQGSGDPLLRSQLALSIASQYLAILEGSHDGDVSCSYFASPKKKIVLSTRFDATAFLR
jgi:hypothetical protein